jgi:hypothetical protein
MKKIIFLFSIFLFFGIIGVSQVKAGVNDNVFGWAWSETIGWISFNSTNCDSDGDGITDTGNYSQCPSGEPISDYGVHIAPDGVFSGYAWSENIGWIKFDPDPDFDTGLYPEDPQYGARIDLNTGEVSGWIRACAGTVNSDCQSSTRTDGWDGWIKLRGITTGGSSYGVELNLESREFEGWAWGSDVVGWVSFNCANPETGNVCGTSDYKVQTSFVFQRVANPPSNLSETLDSCAWGTSPQVALGLSVILNWNYSDPDGDPQEAYEVWVDDDPNFSGAKFNHIVEPSQAASYALNLSQDDDGDWLSSLEWGRTYYWKVRVKDAGSEQWSDFSAVDSFTTPLHASPYPNFQPSPQNPSLDELVEFIQNSTSTAQATCYSGGEHLCQDDPNTDYAWDFDYQKAQGFTIDSTFKGNATTTYSLQGVYQVGLKITDNTLPAPNNYCIGEATVNVRLSLPKWKEVAP